MAALTGKHDTLVRRAPGWQGALRIHLLTRLSTEGLGPRHGEVRRAHQMLNAALRQLHQLRRPRRQTLRQMQPQTPPVKCVSWHRTMGSRWYPADMGFFARAARTALLLWTRAQSAVETSPW